MATPIPLIGGAYRAQSLIANAQRSVNLYAERNTEDANVPVTHYLTPGLRALATPDVTGEGRGLYLASNGMVFGVVKNKLVRITYSSVSGWAMIEMGGITLATNHNPVSMSDNGDTLVLVDGSTNGYTVDLTTLATGSITDTAFYGADKVDYMDTYLLFNKPGTRFFYSSLSNTVAFDPTWIAGKSVTQDPLSTLIVMHRELWLFGTQRGTELFYNSGGSFPFEIIPGVFIEQGCVAKYSAAKFDQSVYWLGINLAGQAIVFRGSKYVAEPISTPAIEYEFSKYSVVSDAIGMIYETRGHTFYVLTFPSADKSWAIDISKQGGEILGEWHEWTWTDSNGNEHRTRVGATVLAFGKSIALDWEDGTLYELTQDVFTDNGDPIVRRRGFPHLVSNGKVLVYDNFVANLDCGNILGVLIPDAPTLSLRWSDTRGHSWGNPVQQSMGATGQFLVQPRWNNLGMARDRVFELFWSTPAFTALQGAWVSGTETNA